MTAQEMLDRGQEQAAEFDAAFHGFDSVDALLDSMAASLSEPKRPKRPKPEPERLTGHWLEHQIEQQQEAGRRALAQAAAQAGYTGKGCYQCGGVLRGRCSCRLQSKAPEPHTD